MPKTKKSAVVDRAAVLAQYRTSSVASRKPEETESLPPLAPETTFIPEVASKTVPSETGASVQSGWACSDSERSALSCFTGDSLASVSTSAVTVLPTSHGWERMMTRRVTVSDLRAARKYGLRELIKGGYIYHHLGVAYVTDESARVCITCWKEKLKPDDLRKNQVLHMRTCRGREGRIIGSRGTVIRAIQAQCGATVKILGTGHVQVSGQDVAADHAMHLIDDLIDCDGHMARSKLANHLRTQMPHGGATADERAAASAPLGESAVTVCCPAAKEEIVGWIIGKQGCGLQKIKQAAAVRDITYDRTSRQFTIRGGNTQCQRAASMLEQRLCSRDFEGKFSWSKARSRKGVSFYLEIKKAREAWPDVAIRVDDGIVSIKAASAAEAKAVAHSLLQVIIERLSSFEAAELETRRSDWSAMLDDLSSRGAVPGGSKEVRSSSELPICEAQVREAHGAYTESCDDDDMLNSDFALWVVSWALLGLRLATKKSCLSLPKKR